MTAAPDSAAVPTIAEAARLIESKALSPVELTELCLRRIRSIDPQINSFLLVVEDLALAAAKRAEKEISAGRWRGPLHGIPIAHKDIYETKGIRTTAHSKTLADHVPDADGTVVAKLADAGTILLGKLATHEFAMGGPSFDLPWPPARNPWNLDHSPGGSSSGTGAAVAAGLVLGGTGSDTGGSIRHPSSFCGVAGVKPTYGLVSRHGILPLAFSLDHPGPLAWTVEDCAILLQAMAGHDERDPASARVEIPDYRAGLRLDLKGVRIGVLRRFHEEDLPVDPEMKRAVDTALATMKDLGAVVHDVHPPPLADFTACCHAIILVEAFAIHAEDFRTRYDDFCEMLKDRIVLGGLISGPDYVQALRFRKELAVGMAAAMADVDVVVTAGAPGPAPTFAGTDKYGMLKRPTLSSPFNVTGQPTVSVCSGFSSTGLPLGIQIAARPYADGTALAVAHAYECASPWRSRRPPLSIAP